MSAPTAHDSDRMRQKRDDRHTESGDGQGARPAGSPRKTIGNPARERTEEYAGEEPADGHDGEPPGLGNARDINDEDQPEGCVRESIDQGDEQKGSFDVLS